MKRKFEIEINGQVVELETQKELKELKKHYNNYDFMVSRRIEEIIATIKQPDIIVDKPRMTIEDLAAIVANLTVEMREGFRKVNERLDQHDLRFDKQDERMNKHWGLE